MSFMVLVVNNWCAIRVFSSVLSNLLATSIFLASLCQFKGTLMIYSPSYYQLG